MGGKLTFQDFLKKLGPEVYILNVVMGWERNPIEIGIGVPKANTQSGNRENPSNFKWGWKIPPT
ncbi:MAG TPA: hypothetical protein DIT95_16930 [Arenibacter sp.]|nr:hypothetical protein [Arenibacter sp.]